MLYGAEAGAPENMDAATRAEFLRNITIAVRRAYAKREAHEEEMGQMEAVSLERLQRVCTLEHVQALCIQCGAEYLAPTPAVWADCTGTR